MNVSASRSREIDATQLRAAVQALDPIVALLCLVHTTGDRSLLTSLGRAFEGTPRGPISTFAGRLAEAPKAADPAIIEQIRKGLIQAVLTNPEPLLKCPGRALFRQMAELCLDTKLNPEACDMAREQAGFAADEGAFEPTRVPPENFTVLVVGAGMVGINAGIKLKAAGFDFRIIEEREEIGGTWSINTYPNAAVDTPSVQYSFSFALNPSWTKYYPRGPEYLAYLKKIADQYGITGLIEFKTAMKQCIWDEARQLWQVACVRDGVAQLYEANAVISAVGFLTGPAVPKIPGLEKFRGTLAHSARWDNTIDLAGKRAVVVGTGATSAQLSTATAARAAHLTIVQRQPNYMLHDPRVFAEVGPEQRYALENIPFVLQWERFQALSTLLTLPTSMASIDQGWRARTGGVSPMNDAVRQICLSYIAEKFADRPDLRAKVTPDFPFFSKRPILDCGYYDTLLRENVTLVEGELAGCEADAVILKDGTRIECDALLLATGFTLEFLAGYDIRGREGRTLKSTWSPYPYAYLGLEIPGFPNFFVTAGPNSALTAPHTVLGEQQMHYIIEVLKTMVEVEACAMEVTQQACDAYNARIDASMAQTIWLDRGTAHGYYLHESGRIVLGYPETNLEYWKQLRRPVLEDYLVTPQSQARRSTEVTVEAAE